MRRAVCDLAAAPASPAIGLSQAPPAANVDTGAVSRDRVARPGLGTEPNGDGELRTAC